MFTLSVILLGISHVVTLFWAQVISLHVGHHVQDEERKLQRGYATHKYLSWYINQVNLSVIILLTFSLDHSLKENVDFYSLVL